MKNGRFKNIALALFYLFSFITLLSLFVYFMDIVLHMNLCVYNIFLGLPPYSYVCTAHCYILNCIQLILKDNKHDVMGNIRRKKQRLCIFIGLSVLMFLIFGQFIYFVQLPCLDPENYKLFLTNASVAVMLALYYFTFLTMMVNNWYLWRHISERNLTSASKVEGKRHLIISLVFAVSFLYRALFNTIRQYTDYIDRLEEINVVAWCFIFMGLHIFGEFLPLALLFLYQLRRCIKLKQSRIECQNSDVPFGTYDQVDEDLSPGCKAICDITGFDSKSINQSERSQRERAFTGFGEEKSNANKSTTKKTFQIKLEDEYQNSQQSYLPNQDDSPTSRLLMNQEPRLSDDLLALLPSGGTSNDMFKRKTSTDNGGATYTQPNNLAPLIFGYVSTSNNELVITSEGKTPIDSEPAEYGNYSPINIRDPQYVASLSQRRIGLSDNVNSQINQAASNDSLMFRSNEAMLNNVQENNFQIQLRQVHPQTHHSSNNVLQTVSNQGLQERNGRYNIEQ